MDDFCGDASNAWGISAKGYLTHCFDDLVLFGATYIFLFVAGSYRAWTLLHVPPAVDFPYSTRHSVKVLVLGWLGLFPIVLFAAKYAQGTHDDFEWVAKPLGSVAWLFSLWLLNMEVARDLRECWVLRVFWASSAGAGTLALPTVVLAAQTNGYGLVFYVYLLHYVLYCTITMLAFRFPHLSHKQTPELIGFGGDGDDSVMGAAATREKNEARLHQGFLTALWRERFLRLMSLYAPERLYIAASFVCMCGGVTLNGLALVVIGRLFNNFYYPYSPDSARGHMREYCVALIFVYIMSSSFDAAYTALVQLAGERMASRMRRKLLHNLLRQEMEFFDGTDSAVLVKAVQTDVAGMQRMLADHIMHGVYCIVSLMVAVAIMFAISWKMALVVLSLAPVCLLAIRIQQFYSSKLGGERGAAMGAATELVRETLSNLREIRSLGAEPRQLDKYKDLAADVYDLSLQTGMVNATSKSSATLMVQLAVALSLYVSGMAVLTRQVEVGYVITFAGAAITAMSAVSQLSPLVAQVTKALTTVETVLALLDRAPQAAAASSSGGHTLEVIEGRLELRDVMFAGAAGERNPRGRREGSVSESILKEGVEPEPLLKNVSLTFPAGSMTAVVHTSARKPATTALMELMQRLYDPEQGAVYLDGHDLRTLDAEWLREHVAVVHQEPVLLAMSLAQNIAFARDSVTQPQVEAAARFANAHDFIQTVPDGYDAQIGDTGVRLTAAQRVQIGLARAILAPAKILILDETLSGLEEEAAQVVLANLRREIAGTRTVIALSSYPQSLRGAFESVALLHEGRIVETGSHQQVSARWPLYSSHADAPASRPKKVALAAGAAEGGSEEHEGVWQKRLMLADQLEDSILHLGLPQGEVMDLVEMVTEIKEALALDG